MTARGIDVFYQVVDGKVRPVFIYVVDVSEFAVNKLRDRGSREAGGVEGR